MGAKCRRKRGRWRGWAVPSLHKVRRNWVQSFPCVATFRTVLVAADGVVQAGLADAAEAAVFAGSVAGLGVAAAGRASATALFEEEGRRREIKTESVFFPPRMCFLFRRGSSPGCEGPEFGCEPSADGE